MVAGERRTSPHPRSRQPADRASSGRTAVASTVAAHTRGEPTPVAGPHPPALGKCPPEEGCQLGVADSLGVDDVALERRAVGHALLGEPDHARMLLVPVRLGRATVNVRQHRSLLDDDIVCLPGRTRFPTAFAQICGPDVHRSTTPLGGRSLKLSPTRVPWLAQDEVATRRGPLAAAVATSCRASDVHEHALEAASRRGVMGACARAQQAAHVSDLTRRARAARPASSPAGLPASGGRSASRGGAGARGSGRSGGGAGRSGGAPRPS